MANRKFEIVQRLLQDRPQGIDEAMLTWWHNLREHGGLRLTLRGYDALGHQLKLESWALKIPDFKTVFTKKIYLELDRKLTWPYYIDRKEQAIRLFGGREAVMARLYGDIRVWMEKTPHRSL
jgi:hypothetical protein